MVAVREAVKISLENLRDIFSGETMPDLRLEEVMLSEDERKWEVTVSYLNPDFDRDMASREKGNNGISQFLRDEKKIPTRLYKTVTISSDQGQLMGIKNEWEMFDL